MTTKIIVTIEGDFKNHTELDYQMKYLNKFIIAWEEVAETVGSNKFKHKIEGEDNV